MRQEILVTRCSIKNKRGPGLRHCQQITQSKYLPKTDESFLATAQANWHPAKKPKCRPKTLRCNLRRPSGKFGLENGGGAGFEICS